jgi:hypothetical protein
LPLGFGQGAVFFWENREKVLISGANGCGGESCGGTSALWENESQSGHCQLAGKLAGVAVVDGRTAENAGMNRQRAVNRLLFDTKIHIFLCQVRYEKKLEKYR